MPQLDVAHVRQQGQDMIIVPLDRSFDLKSLGDQQATADQIQLATNSAGLPGAVAVVWPSGSDMKFIAPKLLHPFFQTIDIEWVLANLNRSLTW